MKTRLFLVILLSLPVLVIHSVDAQVDFPTKPIQIVIGYAPGGSTDVLIRTLAQEAKKFLGQEVVIINKAGAGGTVAAIGVAT